jgi:hypothetical protein
MQQAAPADICPIVAWIHVGYAYHQRWAKVSPKITPETVGGSLGPRIFHDSSLHDFQAQMQAGPFSPALCAIQFATVVHRLALAVSTKYISDGVSDNGVENFASKGRKRKFF